jgi:hypothetical protein
MLPSVTIREYDKTTGKFVKSGAFFDSGTIVLGNTGDTKVFDFLINGSNQISDLSISIAYADNVEIAPGDAVISNNLSDRGNFGIETESSFVANKTISHYFSGIDKPVDVPFRSIGVSDYVYVNIQAGTFKKESSVVRYKIKLSYGTAASSSSSSSGIYPSSSSSSSSKSSSSVSSMSCSSSSCSSSSQY